MVGDVSRQPPGIRSETKRPETEGGQNLSWKGPEGYARKAISDADRDLRTETRTEDPRTLGNLHPPPPAYVWRFKVRETYDQDSTQVTRQQNPDRCNRDVNTYGGCRWSGCVIHDAYNEVRSGPFFWKDGTFNIRVRDSWDQRWVAGVMGKLYGGGWSSTPSGTIYISRVLAPDERGNAAQPEARLTAGERSGCGRSLPHLCGSAKDVSWTSPEGSRTVKRGESHSMTLSWLKLEF
ncbi:hypothetical protein QTO34_017093 [Cnephaeus nilssonii]|uniref:Uncharacterized protein n=1 Tax=Cnephaeus nilssonii TaxID=3371016 RepID=A0AA40I0D7_CNENI|nr:hypothetical protein QTO34_017093 [Eptesicus nilssonii]